MAGSDLVGSLLKGMDMLRLISESTDGLRLAEIEAGMELKKTTAHNLARTLRSRGFLVKDAMERYNLGPAIGELARGQHKREVLLRAEKVLKDLAERFPEGTLTFMEQSGTEVVCRLRRSPDRPGVTQRPIDHTMSPYSSASGLCLQAFNHSFRVELSTGKPFEEYGQAHWRSRERFEAEMKAIRLRGHALIQSESGQLRIAVPVGERFSLGLSFQSNAGANPESIAAAVVAAAKGIA